MEDAAMYIVVVYIPEGHLHQVKQAMFRAGAGNIGSYSECGWEVKGWGQYRPLEGSEPYLGERSMLNRVSEYRVEVAAEEKCLKQVVEAMLEAHPYEVPAYHVYKGMTLTELRDILTAGR